MAPPCQNAVTLARDEFFKKVAAALKVSPALVYKWCEPPEGAEDPDASGAKNPLDRVRELYVQTKEKDLINWLCHEAGGFFVASLARYLATRRGPGWLSLRILAWTTTLVRWPWLLMSFFVAVAVAWTADNREPAEPAGRLRLRAIESASLAVVLGGVQWSFCSCWPAAPRSWRHAWPSRRRA